MATAQEIATMTREDVNFEVRLEGMKAWDEAMKKAKATGAKTPTWPDMMAIVFAAMSNKAAETRKASA